MTGKSCGGKIGEGVFGVKQTMAVKSREPPKNNKGGGGIPLPFYISPITLCDPPGIKPSACEAGLYSQL